MNSELHDSWCKWPQGLPCRKFSTDGTLPGAEIAHTMGTMDEKEIQEDDRAPFLSDVDAEQADWDADEQYEHTACNGEGCDGCGGVGRAPVGEPGPHPHYDEERILEYRNNGLDWN